MYLFLRRDYNRTFEPELVLVSNVPVYEPPESHTRRILVSDILVDLCTDNDTGWHVGWIALKKECATEFDKRGPIFRIKGRALDKVG